MANSWILKTEPSSYSWADLARDGHAVWDGVSNAAALLTLRAMAAGDEVLIYHSGDGREIVGIARVRKSAYPDPALRDPKRVVVEVEPVRAVKSPVTLAAIKAEPTLASLGLVRQGRLSCMPVTREQRRALRALGVR